MERPVYVSRREWGLALKRQEKAKAALAKFEREIEEARKQGKELTAEGELALDMSRKLAASPLEHVQEIAGKTARR